MFTVNGRPLSADAVDTDEPTTITAILEQPDASPFEVVFADEGLPNLPNANYKVFVGGPTNATLHPGSRTTTGLTLVGGDAGDEIHLQLINSVD